MERFAPALRRVARELDLPRRTRTPLLLEMAADLEAVFEHHRARGVPEDEAARRAEETVLGSSEVIRRLGRLHRSPWRDWSEEVGARLAGGVDLVLLAAGVVPMVGLAAAVSAWALSADAGPLLWVVLAIGLLMAAVVSSAWLRLLRGQRSRRPLHPTLLVLAALAPAVGLLALVAGVHGVATGAVGASSGQAIAAVVARDGATFLVGLLLGVTGLLAWFILQDREARRASREVDALLQGDTAAPDSRAVSGDDDTIIPLARRRHG